MAEKLYLIDGTALLYRAHFAFIKNPLINSKGMNTSAIYGVINSFISLIETQQAEHIAISFDRKAPTFRHEMYKAYKAQRPPMPDDLIAQIAPVHEFFALIGLPEIGMDGFEADDVLGTLAAKFKESYDIVLVTSDKDYCQLVNDSTILLDPMKNVKLDKAAVFAKYGVYPQQFVDYLALVGDASDNIPGVKSIGPKTAEALLKEFGSLDGIYGNLDKVAPKLKERLQADQDNAYLSQKLAAIELNVPIALPDYEGLAFNTRSLRLALPLLIEYEISSIRRKIESKYPASVASDNSAIPATSIVIPAPLSVVPAEAGTQPYKTDIEYQDDIFSRPDTPAPQHSSTPAPTDQAFQAVLIDKLSFVTMLAAIKAAPIVSLDTETDSIDPMQAALVGISLCVNSDIAYYLPIAHNMADNLSQSEVLLHLKDALKDKLIIGHNLKYDLIVLHRHGLTLSNPLFDTMLAAYILDPGTNSYSLDECALRDLSHEMIPISQLIGKGKNQISFDLVDPVEACVYAAEDAWAVFQLYPIYRRRIDFSGMHLLFDDIELPLIKVLQKMEENGVAIDCNILGEISHLINIELKKLTEQIYGYAGYEFNLNSTQQLAKLLFEEKHLPNKKKTKTGFSTDNSVLEELAADYEIAQIIISYRQLSKLQSTYVSALPKMLNPHTNRIHSSFNQTVTSTGRLSSSNPNLQNISVRTELGREIRKAFCAIDAEHLILAADYSQIELRLLALMSKDVALIEAFKNGLDIHKGTAAKIYNIPLSEVTQDQRRAAKTIIFGILYGMGQRKLARDLGISQNEAKNIIESYFAQFPSIRNFISQSIVSAQQEGFCETIFGRRLSLPNINSKHPGYRSEAERIAVNMPIQGSAADLIKIAMIDINKRIEGNPQIKMVLQVHDELVFEIHKDSIEAATQMVQTAMENALPEDLRKIVELKTDVEMGKNWYEAH
ncbi:DNA polymerase I [Candidatus Cloacimonadota bacterium]